MVSTLRALKARGSPKGPVCAWELGSPWAVGSLCSSVSPAEVCHRPPRLCQTQVQQRTGSPRRLRLSAFWENPGRWPIVPQQGAKCPGTRVQSGTSVAMHPRIAGAQGTGSRAEPPNRLHGDTQEPAWAAGRATPAGLPWGRALHQPRVCAGPARDYRYHWRCVRGARALVCQVLALPSSTWSIAKAGTGAWGREAGPRSCQSLRMPGNKTLP